MILEKKLNYHLSKKKITEEEIKQKIIRISEQNEYHKL